MKKDTLHSTLYRNRICDNTECRGRRSRSSVAQSWHLHSEQNHSSQEQCQEFQNEGWVESWRDFTTSTQYGCSRVV